MIAFVLKCRATGLYCAGVETGRKSVMVTESLDHAEAWDERNKAVEAARALGRASGAFCWFVEERGGDVASRLLDRLRHGARRASNARNPAELTEGQYFAVRETVRILNAAVNHLDRACAMMREGGIQFDDRPFSLLYDRLWAVGDPYNRMILDHMAAKVEGAKVGAPA